MTKTSAPTGASTATVDVPPAMPGLFANVTGPGTAPSGFTSTTTLSVDGETKRGRRNARGARAGVEPDVAAVARLAHGDRHGLALRGERNGTLRRGQRTGGRRRWRRRGCRRSRERCGRPAAATAAAATAGERKNREKNEDVSHVVPHRSEVPEPG